MLLIYLNFTESCAMSEMLPLFSHSQGHSPRSNSARARPGSIVPVRGSARVGTSRACTHVIGSGSAGAGIRGDVSGPMGMDTVLTWVASCLSAPSCRARRPSFSSPRTSNASDHRSNSPMAGPAPDFQLPNSSWFNIYADAPVAAQSPGLPLPGGPCNYVDLTPGAGGHKCGCRRFWSRTSFAGSERGSPVGFPSALANPYEDQTPWCMCSHHACFHDDARDSQTPVPNPVIVPVRTNGQENERPRTGREPLTPVVPDLSFHHPPSLGQDMDTIAPAVPSSFSDGPVVDARLDQPAGPSLPDTLPWASLIHSEPDRAGSLPPIPSQCLMPSQPSSTTSSARIAYHKPFAGRGLQTLSSVRPTRLKPIQIPGNSAEPDDEDATEPDANQSGDDAQTVTNTPQSARQRDMTNGPVQSPTPAVNREAFYLLSNTVQGHEQRIENLENVSFSAAAHDTCHEKHDQTDLRVTELESRVEEVEKILNDSGNNTSGYNWSRREKVDDATASVVSVSTSTGSYTMDRAELQNELQALKTQLSQLQGVSSFPSPTHPWEVEVVFLPFPLKNIWLGSRDFTSQRLSHGNSAEADLWTQLPNSPEAQSPGFSDWAGPEVESDWLLGRACAADKMIGQRLRSRGLVKNISVCGPDARSVQQAMLEAFGTLFRTFSRMQSNVYHGSTTHHRVTKFLGLQSPWIPLRKLHKDSRLRFLTPAEMVTPVSWDVQFLVSSVVMKSQGVHRLFITHPEAYLQDQYAYENRWTWQRLRELSRVYADSQSSQEILEGDAKEDCWVWSDILDEPLATSSHAFKVQASAREHCRATSTLSSSRDIFTDARATTPSLGTRRSGSRLQSPAVASAQERRASTTPRIRTVSMPSTLPGLVSPVTTKRRITPHRYLSERHISAQPVWAAQMAPLVKRRSTRSPSVRPLRNRYTPWSTSSPSPMLQPRVSRALTPAYATPYSNAPPIGSRSSRNGAHVLEDDDMDFDFDSAESGSGSGSDIEIYDDEAVNNDNGNKMESDGDDDNRSMADLGNDSYQSQSQESWQDGQMLDDEPWRGCEDLENRDQEINIHVDDDAMMDDDGDENDLGGQMISADEHETQSQGSSVPSEYPSNRPLW
ncbi:hypothetical protein F4777DRAFT_586630 [Nemania sp. FL0916]|nr:hypothetical protein F4777DRAFT_586630 [Nemania sp. FL0916]